MKRKVWSKFSSFALTLAMLLSLLPVTPAMAADVPLSCTTSTAVFTASDIFGSTDLGNYLGNGGLTQPVCGSDYADVADINGKSKCRITDQLGLHAGQTRKQLFAAQQRDDTLLMW